MLDGAAVVILIVSFLVAYGVANNECNGVLEKKYPNPPFSMTACADPGVELTEEFWYRKMFGIFMINFGLNFMYGQYLNSKKVKQRKRSIKSRRKKR